MPTIVSFQIRFIENSLTLTKTIIFLGFKDFLFKVILLPLWTIINWSMAVKSISIILCLFISYIFCDSGEGEGQPFTLSKKRFLWFFIAFTKRNINTLFCKIRKGAMSVWAFTVGTDINTSNNHANNFFIFSKKLIINNIHKTTEQKISPKAIVKFNSRSHSQLQLPKLRSAARQLTPAKKISFA